MILSSYMLCIVQRAKVVDGGGDSLDDAALRAGVFWFDGCANLAGDGFARRHDGLNQRLAKLGRVPILGRTITTKAMPVPGNGGRTWPVSSTIWGLFQRKWSCPGRN